MGEVKRVTSEDLQVVKDLAYSTWPDTFKDILSPEQITYMLNWMYDLGTLKKQATSGHQFFVFYDHGKALGFIGVEPNHPKDGELKIHKLYVLPDTQGSGIGKQLIQKASELARSMGIHSLVLNVNRFNKAVEFYKHLGFQIALEENIDIGNGYWMEDYVMTLDLQ